MSNPFLKFGRQRENSRGYKPEIVDEIGRYKVSALSNTLAKLEENASCCICKEYGETSQ